MTDRRKAFLTLAGYFTFLALWCVFLTARFGVHQHRPIVFVAWDHVQVVVGRTHPPWWSVVVNVR